MRTKITVSALVVAMSLCGCADMSETQKSTTTGAGIGAVAGGIIGGMTGGGGVGRVAAGAGIGALIGGGGGYLWGQHMQKQKEDMQKATQGTGVEVTQTQDNQLKINVPSDISFAQGSAEISPKLASILDTFADNLKAYPDTTVAIYGFTDNTGSDTVNLPLSRQRAANVRDYLVKKGVAANRFYIEGHGSSQPVADNRSEAGRAKNRRVEIYVAEAAKQGASSSTPSQQQPSRQMRR
ncbi:OmpA family protein [Oxalobacter vibrioformis]|uniref:OmpA family protein n=1 Tax=Oxalobacter vibrioformis TaxID=933080 RepID=A0A9E9LYX7_9BURK|nr:OmpA family protein [Oxalobacter vibrioformis]NLC23443.1 OmpA family protein [Oxalobacter sp.]WAW09798.1 OmpA family protein [Oxalobacter vibrioformis]